MNYSGLVTLLYRVQVDSHVRKPWTVLLTQGTIYRYAPDAPAATGVSPRLVAFVLRYTHSLLDSLQSRVYPDYSLYRTLRAQSTLYRHGVYSRLVGPIT